MKLSALKSAKEKIYAICECVDNSELKTILSLKKVKVFVNHYV